MSKAFAMLLMLVAFIASCFRPSAEGDSAPAAALQHGARVPRLRLPTPGASTTFVRGIGIDEGCDPAVTDAADAVLIRTLRIGTPALEEYEVGFADGGSGPLLTEMSGWALGRQGGFLIVSSRFNENVLKNIDPALNVVASRRIDDEVIGEIAADAQCARVTAEAELPDGGWRNVLQCLRDADLQPAWTATLAVFGNGIALDDQGNALVDAFQAAHGPFSLQWVDASGRASRAFVDTIPSVTYAGWTSYVGLVGGVARRDNLADGGTTWVEWFPSLSTRGESVPLWLAERPNTTVAIIEGGAGYAFFPPTDPGSPSTRTFELVDGSGQSAGWVTVETPATSHAGFTLGFDGSLILSGTQPMANGIDSWCTSTIWPQLLR